MNLYTLTGKIHRKITYIEKGTDSSTIEIHIPKILQSIQQAEITVFL